MKTQNTPWTISKVEDITKPLAHKFLNNKFEVNLSMAIEVYICNQEPDQHGISHESLISDFRNLLAYSFMSMSIGQGIGAEYFARCLAAGHGIKRVCDEPTNKPLYYLALSIGKKLHNEYCNTHSEHLLHKSDKKILKESEQIANTCFPIIQKNKHMATSFYKKNVDDNDCITWTQAVGFSKIIDSIVHNNWSGVSFWYAIPSSRKPASPLNILHLVELNHKETNEYIKDAYKNPYQPQPELSTPSYYCDPSLAGAVHNHNVKHHHKANESTNLTGEDDGCFSHCTIL